MTNRIKTVVVGAGRGRSQVRSLGRAADLFELTAWVDLDLERLHGAIDEAGLPRELASDSLDDTLASRDVDAVVVATWARTHEPLVGRALDAGKHVLVEKPYTLTLAAARALQDRADAAGLRVVVNQQWRYMPGQRTMRRLLADRAYGEPQTGHLVTYKARGGEYPDSEHSQLWQMTVHEIDSAIAMLGQPIAEVAGHSYRPPATTWRRESTAVAELTFANGARVAMVSTSDARVSSHEFRVECERGALVYLNTRGFGGQETLRAGHGSLAPVPIDGEIENTRDLDVTVMRSWGEWITGGPEPETSGRRNLHVIGALDALLRSTVSGRVERVEL